MTHLCLFQYAVNYRGNGQSYLLFYRFSFSFTDSMADIIKFSFQASFLITFNSTFCSWGAKAPLSVSDLRPFPSTHAKKNFTISSFHGDIQSRLSYFVLAAFTPASLSSIGTSLSLLNLIQRDPAFKKVDVKKVRHCFSKKSLIL